MQYNAVLRGFPNEAVAALKVEDGKTNKYETTIFVLTSAIVKLSKVTDIPPNRRLWRGLDGMILPDHFWRYVPESIIMFHVKVSWIDPYQKALEARCKDIDRENGGITVPTKVLDLKMIFSEAGYLEAAVACKASTQLDESWLEAFSTLRVVSEPTQAEERGGIEMTVALSKSKDDFSEDKQLAFQLAVARACSKNKYNLSVDVGNVKLLEIEGRPKDFLGAGILSTYCFRYELLYELLYSNISSLKSSSSLLALKSVKS